MPHFPLYGIILKLRSLSIILSLVLLRKRSGMPPINLNTKWHKHYISTTRYRAKGY